MHTPDLVPGTKLRKQKQARLPNARARVHAKIEKELGNATANNSTHNAGKKEGMDADGPARGREA